MVQWCLGLGCGLLVFALKDRHKASDTLSNVDGQTHRVRYGIENHIECLTDRQTLSETLSNVDGQTHGVRYGIEYSTDRHTVSDRLSNVRRTGTRCRIRYRMFDGQAHVSDTVSNVRWTDRHNTAPPSIFHVACREKMMRSSRLSQI